MPRQQCFPSYTILGLVVLSLSVLVGCTCLPHGTGDGLWPVVVFVIGTEKTVPEPVYVRAEREEVHWYACGSLKIRFEDPTVCPELRCDGNHCRSGKISRAKKSKSPYQYHAEISGERRSQADPGMIVW